MVNSDEILITHKDHKVKSLRKLNLQSSLCSNRLKTINCLTIMIRIFTCNHVPFLVNVFLITKCCADTLQHILTSKNVPWKFVTKNIKRKTKS